MNAEGYFDILIETYTFPLKIINVDSKGENQAIPTPTGKYLIQFKYIGTDKNNYWSGIVSSNAIEVCIK